jgi:hypothetical protein
VQIHFHTAQAPRVVAALPDSRGVAADTPVALVFSQPMVSPDALDQPTTLPQLQITPPFTGTVRWITADTLLLQPDTPLLPDTQYRATLRANLSDVRGIELDRAFSWSWRTRGPSVLGHSPNNGERWVAPNQPLVIVLSRPLELDALRAGLHITPTISGDLEASTLISGTQIVTFTPSPGWNPGSSYDVSLRTEGINAGRPPPGIVQTPSSASATPDAWSFTAAPVPDLVARFPGPGQLLPRDQAIRLVFSTPMEATTLQSGLSLDPPVDDLRLSVNETEVRVHADLLPATAYTLTIAADVSDRNGTPLERELQVRFLTAPSPPALAIPNLTGHIVSLPVDRPASIEIEHTNLSRLNFDLYQLDDATLLRTFNFSDSDWEDFQPERYGQALVERWQRALDEPLNQRVQTTVPITQTQSQPLDPGAYYLRISAAEGPRVDVVLLVSRIALTLKQSEQEVLVWAVDTINGAPLADLPLALYKGGAVVARGRSDANGLWIVQHQRRANDPPYLAIGGDAAPAVVRSDWRLTAGLSTDAQADGPNEQIVLFADNQTYAPGATINLGGFVRRIGPSGGLELPPDDARLSLALQREENSTIVTTKSVDISVSGVISASLDLDAELEPGAYVVRATFGDAVNVVPIQVVAPNPFLTVMIDTPKPGDSSAASRQLQGRVISVGVPVANANVTWNATAVSIPASRVENGFVFGDDEQALPPPRTFEATRVTDAAGQFEALFPDLATLTQTVRYQATVRVDEPGGISAQETVLAYIKPAQLQLGLRPASNIVRTTEAPVIELLALDAQGAPAPGEALELDVYQRIWSDRSNAAGQPRDSLALTRRATTDDQGRASLNLARLSPGEYRVVVKSGLAQSATTLWVTRPGYAGWRNDGDQVRIIADRAVYSPGDVAQLLVTMPYAAGTALIAFEQNGRISAEMRTIRAGELTPIPITAGMAPNTHVSVLVTGRNQSDIRQTLKAGYVNLQVAVDSPVLTTTITPDATSYAPGATAQLTITTAVQSSGIPADLVLLLIRGDTIEPLPTDLFATLNAQRSSGFITAQTQALGAAGAPEVGVSTGESAAMQQTPAAIWLDANQQTGDDGTLLVSVPLPQEAGVWSVAAYAARNAQLFGQGSAIIRTETTLDVQARTPARLRLGDQTGAALDIRNTTALTQEIRAVLVARGVEVQSSNLITQTLASGEQRRFEWPIRAAQVMTSTLNFTVSTADGFRTNASRSITIEPDAVMRNYNETLEVTRSLSHTIVISAGTRRNSVSSDYARLIVALAPDVRTAITASATRLAALAERNNEQEASLLHLSVLLAHDAAEDEEQRWREQARLSLAALEDAQGDDGGWGWWAGEPFHPFVTGYVLEAQARANQSLGLNIEFDERTLELLRRADGAGVDPDLRAYLHYVRGLIGDGDSFAAAALLNPDLQAEGLAYLALMLPPDQANVALARLTALAQRPLPGLMNQNLVSWMPGDGAALPRSTTSTTALAVHALQRLQADSPLINPALAALRQAWSVDGWPNAFDSSRAGAALLARSAARTTERPRGYRLLLNGQELFQTSQALTETHYVTVPGDQLRAANELRIELSGATQVHALTPVLLAYQLQAPAQANTIARPAIAAPGDNVPPIPVTPRRLAIQQDYVDPVSGATLDPTALQLGQLVQVRLTVVVAQPITMAEVEAALPAAFALLDVRSAAPFRYIRQVTGLADDADAVSTHLVFAGADLDPGVYTQTYLARAVATGAFVAPPPQTRPVFGSETVVIGVEKNIIVSAR